MITNLKTRKAFIFWGLIIGIVLLICGLALYALPTMDKQSISNFGECKNAGGAIAESYPEQCFIDGKSFVNSDQNIDKQTDEYIGLSEQDAMSKAKEDGTQARVVQRDNESLPVTMDYVPGRLNFYVRDGKIEEVNIEGESMQQ